MGAMDKVRNKSRMASIAVQGIKVDVRKLTKPEYESIIDRVTAMSDEDDGEGEREADVFAELFFEPGTEGQAFTAEFVEAEMPMPLRHEFISEFHRIQRGDVKN